MYRIFTFAIICLYYEYASPICRVWVRFMVPQKQRERGMKRRVQKGTLIADSLGGLHHQSPKWAGPASLAPSRGREEEKNVMKPCQNGNSAPQLKRKQYRQYHIITMYRYS